MNDKYYKKYLKYKNKYLKLMNKQFIGGGGRKSNMKGKQRVKTYDENRKKDLLKYINISIIKIKKYINVKNHLNKEEEFSSSKNFNNKIYKY